MKIGHLVLFAAAASVLTYLSSALKDENNDDDKILKELEELTDDNNKLQEDNSTREDIEDISNSLKYIGESILDDLFKEDNNQDEPINIEKEEYEDTDDLIDDIEKLLAKLDEGEKVESFDEDAYYKEICKAIDNSITLNENGESVDLSQELEKADELTEEEIDEIFSEILKSEEASNEIVEKENAENEYLESLVAELKEAIKEDEVIEEKDIYTKINELYPYLSINFVRAVYDLKEELATEYEFDKKIILLHRINFETIEDLRQFTEIVLEHDYRVNVDESQMIVDVFKEFINEDGKILTNIFEIANQAKVLNGNYEGYHVEVLN